MSGIASLLGGDDAISAMIAVHVYGKRRWLGWYNNPGSFQIAKRLNSFAKSASFHNNFSQKLSFKSLPKSVQMDPTALLELGDCRGAKFWPAHPGTIIDKTGYLTTLFMKECAAWGSDGVVVPGRRTRPIGVTIADLGQAPASEKHPAGSSASTLFFASIPIVFSVGTCVLCAVREDWYASSLVLVGIIASGLSGLVLGSADFVFLCPEPTEGSPAGDGILISGKDIMLLRGTEGAVNSITRGRFSLRFSSEGHYNLIRLCSVLFFIQSITQLFLIPQASLFGQAMFFASLGVSALYNAWSSSLDREQIHCKILFEKVLENPTLTKYTFGTRTTAVVFVLLVLQPSDPAGLLNELLPDNTKVWKQWKTTILGWLGHPNDRSFQLGDDLDGFTQQNKELLGLLYEDARAAYNGYRDYLRVDST